MAVDCSRCAGGTFRRGCGRPAAVAQDYTIKDFHFSTGESLPELRMHFLTLGEPRRDSTGRVRNAVLIMHGTTGSSAPFLHPEFAGELFGKGQLLDASRYFLILPDSLGHGQSSKPSDGLHAKFPHYGYADMVEAQYRLLTEGLHVDHLRLVMGTSMGGMHTWVWGETYPDFMDALMPLATLPTQISGRNRVWRRMIIDSITNSPDWLNGEYQSQPSGLRVAVETLFFMSENSALRVKEAPTLAAADAQLDTYVAQNVTNHDANDVLYALNASHDYDPGPGLEKITAPLMAINTADDLINPPDQRILEHEIKRVKHGKAIVIPESDKTNGLGTHTLAAVWKKYLADLLKRSERQPQSSRHDAPRRRRFPLPSIYCVSSHSWIRETKVEGCVSGFRLRTPLFIHCPEGYLIIARRFNGGLRIQYRLSPDGHVRQVKRVLRFSAGFWGITRRRMKVFLLSINHSSSSPFWICAASASATGKFT